MNACDGSVESKVNPKTATLYSAALEDGDYHSRSEKLTALTASTPPKRTERSCVSNMVSLMLRHPAGPGAGARTRDHLIKRYLRVSAVLPHSGGIPEGSLLSGLLMRFWTQANYLSESLLNLQR